MSGSGFVAGLIVGAAIGVVAGALLASRSDDANEQESVSPPAELAEAGTLARVRWELAHRLAAGRAAFHLGREETRARMQRELREARGRAQLVATATPSTRPPTASG
jgi:hypothetical protein